MTKISILGCGWLGLPLAKALIKNGFSVKGSTTSADKIPILKNIGISPFLLTLESTTVSGQIEDFLAESTILIVNIPPKLRAANSENFVDKITFLIPFLEKSTVEKVLFVSSTAVYRDENNLVTEETQRQPDTESGRQLVQTELLLQSSKHFKTTVLRFSGLIGEDRHPAKFLAGRENLANPLAPINLIHQQDCIAIILKIIEKDSWNETFNAAAPYHPSREDYYTQKSLKWNLALPKFDHSIPSLGKTILSTKIETILNYTFTKTDL
jgi:nucleoside-diphosphate-sugar epimerase